MHIDITTILQVLTPVFLTLLGWGARLIWSEIRNLRNEQRAYITKETCSMHREYIEKQLAELKGQK